MKEEGAGGGEEERSEMELRWLLSKRAVNGEKKGKRKKKGPVFIPKKKKDAGYKMNLKDTRLFSLLFLAGLLLFIVSSVV